MNFSFYIAKRYLVAKNSNNAINIITIIASLGVIVGSAALFVILSGFSGLRTFSDSLLEVSDPDIKILPVKGKTFEYINSIENTLINNLEVSAFSKVVEERVFLSYKGSQAIAHIKGVDVNYNQVLQIDSLLNVGVWLDSEIRNTAVLGNGIAFQLSIGFLNYGEPLKISVPKAGKGFLNPRNFLRTENTQLIGVYSGSQEFENKYVFTDIQLAQSLLQYENNQISAIEIRIDNKERINTIAKDLQNNLGETVKVKTKAQLNELYYKVINTENFVSYLIFTLILIIAMFNVIGAIIMMIIDKKTNLKTLLNIGATLKQIKRIFVFQGFLLTVLGMCIGLLLATFLILIQQQFSLFMLTRDLAYPVELHLSNLLIVMLTITVLGFVAAKIASSRISLKFIQK